MGDKLTLGAQEVQGFVQQVNDWELTKFQIMEHLSAGWGEGDGISAAEALTALDKAEELAKAIHLVAKLIESSVEYYRWLVAKEDPSAEYQKIQQRIRPDIETLLLEGMKSKQ